MTATISAAAGADAGARRPRRRAERVRDAVVTTAGALGLLVVAWLVVAWALQLSVIVFVTGSMSPTLPTGSAAVVQAVAAADLAAGDVVTVPRPDTGRPVTHRIVAVEPVPGTGGARALTLKGDANSAADTDRYVVEDARRVVIPLPGAGWVAIWAQSPVVMVAGTLAVAALVAWGLWPARASRDDPSSQGSTP